MNTRFIRAKAPHRFFLAITTVTALTGCNSAPPAQTQTPGAPVVSTQTPTTTASKAASKPPKVGETAPDFQLIGISGEKIKLSEAAKNGPVVLVMLRGYPGYQCPLCTVQVGRLMAKAKQFSAAKTRVLLVYPGPAKDLKTRAGEFVKGKTMPQNFDLLLDPDYAFTNQYGLRWDAKNETSYPSTFVLNSARKVLFAKVSREHGDRAKVEEVLAALPK